MWSHCYFQPPSRSALSITGDGSYPSLTCIWAQSEANSRRNNAAAGTHGGLVRSGLATCTRGGSATRQKQPVGLPGTRGHRTSFSGAEQPPGKAAPLGILAYVGWALGVSDSGVGHRGNAVFQLHWAYPQPRGARKGGSTAGHCGLQAGSSFCCQKVVFPPLGRVPYLHCTMGKCDS